MGKFFVCKYCIVSSLIVKINYKKKKEKQSFSSKLTKNKDNTKVSLPFSNA